MNCKNKDDFEYKKLISKLPKGYQDSYHKLLQWSMIYVILFAFARRASEGVDALSTRHFEKVYDEEEEYYYFTQVMYQATKNHQ